MTKTTQQFNPSIDLHGPAQCPICAGQTSVIYKGHPSWIYSKTYDIHACADCLVSFANPLYVEQKEYDAIYENAEHTAGYAKYHAISQRICATQNPLEAIASLGDVYAFVKTRLDTFARQGDSILEVGCGLGYLTYALRKAGYDATGIDVSSVSISRAIALHGSFFKHIEPNMLSKLGYKRFKFIVLTEVIEHVVNPVEFLSSLQELLADDGMLLLTTPNKSAFPPKALWMTDAPPIHLWWFSEKSMVFMAERAGLKCKIFEGYIADNVLHHYWKSHDDLSKPMFVPKFDVKGKLVKYSNESFLQPNNVSVLKHIYAKFIPIFLKIFMIKINNILRKTKMTEKPSTMFVELSR